MKVYISGPISGIDRAVYLANFSERERELRMQGYAVVNPTRLAPCRWPWLYRLMGYRLTLLYDIWHLLHCDGITMLDGWQHSRGARLEWMTSMTFHIEEIDIESGLNK